jgi:SPP1 family phage portal protein
LATASVLPDFSYELRQFRKELKDFGEPQSETLLNAINKHELRSNIMMKNFRRYLAREFEKDVPIFTRELQRNKKAVNNKINVDFVGQIVDMKVGYFAGDPIAYSYDKTKPEAEVAIEQLQWFARRNVLEDKDEEVTKFCSLCGYGARLLYLKDGQERVLTLKPWETILIGTDGITEPEFAIRYYDYEVEAGEVKRRVEFYTPTQVFYYIDDAAGFSKDLSEPMNPKMHLYDYCPIIGYENNSELLSDIEKHLALIDAYDRSLSDMNSFIEGWRLAYMKAKGFRVDEKAVEQARLTGVFSLDDKDMDIDFFTQDINDGAIENHLDRIKREIYEKSGTPNMSDESFSGNASGVALEHKLTAFENKRSTFEKKFKTATIRMFEVLATSWSKKRIPFDAFSVNMQFKRNLPEDLEYEAKIQNLLKGLMSDTTRLSLFSQIKDVDKELELIEEENSVNEQLMLGQANQLVPPNEPESEENDVR